MEGRTEMPVLLLEREDKAPEPTDTKHQEKTKKAKRSGRNAKLHNRSPLADLTQTTIGGW